MLICINSVCDAHELETYSLPLRILTFQILLRNMNDVGHICVVCCLSLGAPTSIQRTAAFKSSSNVCAIFVCWKIRWNPCGAS